jgi:multidrug efflux pump subunit AcrA (membrane-fusion protein)
MKKITDFLNRAFVIVKQYAVLTWKRFRVLALWLQGVIVIVILALLFGLFSLLSPKADTAEANSARTVTLRSVTELSGNATGESIIGSVRSRSEAQILAEAGGTVRSLNTTIGAAVPAGFVIAELENDAARASVLQAEGAYDAAIASRSAVSPADVTTNARNAYRSAFTTLDALLENDVDAFFGSYTPTGPRVLLSHLQTDPATLSRKRAALQTTVDAWRKAVPSADTRDSKTLLNEAETIAHSIQALIEDLARSANDSGSGVTDDQMSALTAARSGVNTVLANIASARANERSGSVSSTASVDAGVKSALGMLRLAQANLEKTIIRAPIAGTVNFLPIRVGDYVTAFSHVATVAQNGALEIVTYVSEGTRTNLSAGMKVTLEDDATGVITAISPALDPVTKQIEVRIAVNGTTALVNGQSVRIQLPSSAVVAAPEKTAGPVLLPLAAVKLAATSRVVFTVGTDGRLVAVPVTIGDVRGERIEITSDLSTDARIVTDARGLSEGQQVTIATQ